MILAADPGSEKQEWQSSKNWLACVKKVIRTEGIREEAEDLLSSHPVSAFIMGRTHHKEIQKRGRRCPLEKMGLPFRTILVDEKYTTEMESSDGRIYLQRPFPSHPQGMRTVPVPIDDYVAWIIGCIYLGKVKGQKTSVTRKIQFFSSVKKKEKHLIKKRKM